MKRTYSLYIYKIFMVQTSFEYRQTVQKNVLYFLFFIYSDNAKSTYFDTDTCKGVNDIFFHSEIYFPHAGDSDDNSVL